MRISPAPDLGPPRRLILAALLVSAVVWATLSIMYWDGIDASLGDTDDAMRLVLVRALMSGTGWWNQHLMRIQPPVGAYMHWSRLLTGAIAAWDSLFHLFMAPDDAETAARFTWPLLWVVPAAIGALMVARPLGAGRMGAAVVMVCAIVLASDIDLYIQFRPGRIDHHDVQMTLCMLALAGAVQRGPNLKGALLSGVATGLGLAVGLEAMLFEAIIGAGLALRFVFERNAGPAALIYAAALLVTTLAAFGIQTPPWRWTVVGCDDIAWNLVGAVAAACLGLLAAVVATARRPWPVRLGALAVVGAIAGAVYLGLDPHCRHGFFADVDPRIRPIWLNFVQEVRPINNIWKRDPSQAAGFISAWALGVIAWAALGFRRARWSDPAWLIIGACLIPAVAVAASAIRMSGYAEWLAVPVLAAAATEVLGLYGKGGILAAALAGAVVSPIVADTLATAATKSVVAEIKAHKPGAKRVVHPTGRKPSTDDACFDTDSFDALADARPPGLVLSEVDLGPFVLASTADSVMSAPYHRLGYGILKAYSILSAPADGDAAARARAAGVSYVLECRGHLRHGDRDILKKNSLQSRLDQGQPPPWLQPLSPVSAPLQTYRVLAPGAKAGPPPAAKPDQG